MVFGSERPPDPDAPLSAQIAANQFPGELLAARPKRPFDPNCRASSAVVASSRTAASATFALVAGSIFRLVVLLIIRSV